MYETLLDTMASIPQAWLDAFILLILGLLIGSFLNVVIYRLPKIMDRESKAAFIEYAQTLDPVPQPMLQADSDKFNLLVPRSKCTTCGHQIKWYENIPVFGYIGLGGRCSVCKSKVSIRYPVIELIIGLLFAYCGFRFGLTWQALAWCCYCAVLVSAAMIDWDTTLLPDVLTLPLMWLGILMSLLHIITTPLNYSVWGAIAGYLSLWVIFQVFKMVTGKEGMGYGDFKLLAALGAWLGIQALIPVLLISSVIGAVIGIVLKLTNKLREGGYMPFGPFLAGAGLVVFFIGSDLILDAFKLY